MPSRAGKKVPSHINDFSLVFESSFLSCELNCCEALGRVSKQIRTRSA
jgi:hypothetical protein